jgi:hypothetical protein
VSRDDSTADRGLRSIRLLGRFEVGSTRPPLHLGSPLRAATRWRQSVEGSALMYVSLLRLMTFRIYRESTGKSFYI